MKLQIREVNLLEFKRKHYSNINLEVSTLETLILLRLDGLLMLFLLCIDTSIFAMTAHIQSYQIGLNPRKISFFWPFCIAFDLLADFTYYSLVLSQK